jgi:hypothetical protein
MYRVTVDAQGASTLSALGVDMGHTSPTILVSEPDVPAVDRRRADPVAVEPDDRAGARDGRLHRDAAVEHVEPAREVVRASSTRATSPSPANSAAS